MSEPGTSQDTVIIFKSKVPFFRVAFTARCWLTLVTTSERDHWSGDTPGSGPVPPKAAEQHYSARDRKQVQIRNSKHGRDVHTLHFACKTHFKYPCSNCNAVYTTNKSIQTLLQKQETAWTCRVSASSISTLRQASVSTMRANTLNGVLRSLST